MGDKETIISGAASKARPAWRTKRRGRPLSLRGVGKVMGGAPLVAAGVLFNLQLPVFRILVFRRNCAEHLTAPAA